MEKTINEATPFFEFYAENEIVVVVGQNTVKIYDQLSLQVVRVSNSFNFADPVFNMKIS